MRPLKVSLVLAILSLGVLLSSIIGREARAQLPVVVVNDPFRNPVPVKDASEVFRHMRGATLEEGSDSAMIVFDILQNERLMIDYISANVTVPPDQRVRSSCESFFDSPIGQLVEAQVSLIMVGQGEFKDAAGRSRSFVASQPVAFSFDGTLRCRIQRSATTGSGSVSWTVFGHIRP